MSIAEMTETTKHLTFKLGNEIYALDISKVREVLVFDSATEIPQMPAFMKGVINLRGKVVSVVDLRLKFGIAGADSKERACINLCSNRRTSIRLSTMYD